MHESLSDKGKVKILE